MASSKRGPSPATNPVSRTLRARGASELLKLMGNPQRLRILCLLAEGERSVGQINAIVTVSPSALSQHLARLRAEGLVDTRKQAQMVYYSLRPGPVLALIRTLHQSYCDSDIAGRST